MIIFLIGPDCSGKDTVRHKLNDILGHAPWIIARSPICNLVYDRIYRRTTKKREHYFRVTIAMFLAACNAKFILLTTDPNELVRRANKRGDDHLKTHDHAVTQLKVYNEVVDEYKGGWPKHFFKVSTDNRTATQVAKEIKRILKLTPKRAIELGPEP